MDFKDYEDKASETAKYRGRGEGNLEYPSLKLCSEAGEVSGKVAKFLYHGVGGKEIADIRDPLIKELGDVLWYLAACCYELDTTLDEVAQVNIDKLSGRLERGTIAGNGDER